LSEDFLEDEFAELALILNLSGPTAETMAESKVCCSDLQTSDVALGVSQILCDPQKPVSKESKVDSFFNILSNQIWGFRKGTEQSKVATSAVKEKLVRNCLPCV
jgi:hypothetical protein